MFSKIENPVEVKPDTDSKYEFNKLILYMLKKYGGLINKGINIKLNIIKKIWSFKEIFLYCLRPTKQKREPITKEIINVIK